MSDQPNSTPLPGTSASLLTRDGHPPVVREHSGRYLRLNDTLLSGTTPPVDDSGSRARSAETTTNVQLSSSSFEAITEEIEGRERQHYEQRWPAHRRRVALVGHGTVLEMLDGALSSFGIRAVRVHHPRAIDADHTDAESNECGFDLVIAFARTPDERRDWDLLDRLPARGCAWLRAYREGAICFIDPLSTHVDDATSVQVLARRLAASSTAEQHLAWLRSGPQAAPNDDATTVLMCARLVTMALAWARAEDDVTHDRTLLWKYVPATGHITHHQVFAYDEPHRDLATGAA